MRATGGMWLFVVASIMASPAAASAQELVDQGFEIDLVQGPVVASGRIIGLGGAHTALAAGIDAAPWNPAAYASRVLWELDGFQWELALSLSFPGGEDFDNDGREASYESSVYWEIGLGFKFDEFGIGLLERNQTYAIEADADTGMGAASVSLRTGHTGFAYAFMDGQLIAGTAIRAAYFEGIVGGETVVYFVGGGIEAGGILRLADQPWRLGVAVRSPVESIDDPDDNIGGMGGVSYVVPRAVHMPWEVQVGFALQLGPKPLNRRWVEPPDFEQDARDRLTMQRWGRERDQVALESGVPPSQLPYDPYRWLPRRAADPAWHQAEAERRREEDEGFDDRVEEEAARDDLALLALPRFYVLLTADLLVTGRTQDGVSVETFLGQDASYFPQAGGDITYAVRLGAETEPWPHRLKIRAGTYLEPSRVEGGSYRPHGTFGFDFRCFTWDLFGLLDPFDVRAGATIDLAARYLDWGIGIGFWH